MLGPSECAATWQKRDKICNAGPPLEQSAKWAKHIILERLPSLPSDPTELEAILFPATSEERLPISPSLSQEYHSASPEAATAFLTPADASKLPRHLSFQRGWRHRSPTDMATFSYVDSSMRQLLHSFRLYSCHPLDHKICQNSSEGVTPDTYMYIAVAGCTMVVGEGIAASQNQAAAHMKRKQLQQSLLPLLYGPLKFIVGHKAAGATFLGTLWGRMDVR